MQFITIAVVAAGAFFGAAPTTGVEVPAKLNTTVIASGQGGILANL